MGRPVVEAFARSMIDVPCGIGKVLFRDGGEVAALWEVLSQEAVGVLICPALPGRIRIGEVDGEAGLLLDAFEAGKLLSVVGGHRASPSSGNGPEGLDGSCREAVCFLVLQRDSEEVAALSFDMGCDETAAFRAFHRVRLPISEAPPAHHDLGPLLDADAAGDAAATGARTPLMMPLPARPAELAIQISADGRVPIDPAVDRLRCNPHTEIVRMVEPDASGDLFRRPTSLQSAHHVAPKRPMIRPPTVTMDGAAAFLNPPRRQTHIVDRQRRVLQTIAPLLPTYCRVVPAQA